MISWQALNRADLSTLQIHIYKERKGRAWREIDFPITLKEADVRTGWGGAVFTISSFPLRFCLRKMVSPKDVAFRKAVGVRRVTFQILPHVDGMEPSHVQL